MLKWLFVGLVGLSSESVLKFGINSALCLFLNNVNVKKRKKKKNVSILASEERRLKIIHFSVYPSPPPKQK
jgi:hypothetical protein